MATADGILEQMEAEAQGETLVCVIDPETRTITVPLEYQLLGVENDKRVERIYFQCPKIVGDNQDLSRDYILFINYVNANGDPDAYKINDMQVEGDNITFSWLLEEKVTLYQGDIQISFCGIIPGDEQEDPDKNRWGTTINTDCTVLTGLKCTQQVAESNPDALAQIWAAIDELKAGGGGSGTPGKDGREIEIQNNGTAIQWRYAGDDDWTDLVQLSDITGAKGDPGENGITPTIGENGNWYLGDEDTGKPSRGEKGDPGQKGDPGDKGDPGRTGATPNIQIGTVQTLEPGQQATASITGTAENPVLNMGIPKGKDGNDGESNERNATPLTDAGREHIPAIVSFIDDDCRSEVYTVLFPLIKNLEIPYTIACPTGSINNSLYITDAQLKEMYDYGVSVSCHTVNQTNMDTVDRNQLREILQQSIDDLSGWGIDDVRTYAYCQGKYTIDNIQVVKEFFDMGFLTDKGINEIPYESYYMKRVGLFPSTGNFTLANAKEYVDQLSESGGWLIFMTHCYTETFNSEELSELVTYIKGKSIPIVDINDAINKTGNVIEVGHYKKDDLESGHYFVVDSLGRTHTDSVIGNSGEVVELVDLVMNEGHQIGKETSSTNKGKDIEMTSGSTTHVVSQPVNVTDCSSVIVTGWAYSGYGIYSFLNSSGECVSALWSTHSLAEGADSVENQEVSVPEGASTIIIAGHKDYIMPALKKVKSSGSDSGSGESYELPIMSDTQLGGGKAVEKTDEDVPVAVDPSTGQLFVPTYPKNAGGGSGVKSYYYEETLEEGIAKVFVPFSEFKGCKRIFAQIYIPDVSEESYNNYIPRAKVDNKDAWSSGKTFASRTITANINNVVIFGELVLNNSDAFFAGGGSRAQYANQTVIGLNAATYGDKFTFNESETSGIYFEINNRTNYSFPAGTKIIVVGM